MAKHGINTAIDGDNDQNVLRKHVAFFDRNNDGVIYPWETFQGFRAIGSGIILSSVAAVFINVGLSSKTRPVFNTAIDGDNDQNVLRKHVAFFDRNNDGVIYPWETFQGFRAIGSGIILSSVAAVFINVGLSSKTRPGKKFPDLLFPIEIKNINMAKHGSDSGSYDTHGRFVASKFEEIFINYARTNSDALTACEVDEFVKGNREPKDYGGCFSRKNQAKHKQMAVESNSKRMEIDEENVLRKHVAFFDRNNDGFRAIGCGYLLSSFAAFFINAGLSGKTRPGKKCPNLLFPIYIENIHMAKHGSDSGVYDNHGRFVPSKFEEIFAKYARTNSDALTAKELDEFVKGNREPKDYGGWIGGLSEWKILYYLAKDKNGLLKKDTVRAVYDGSLFEKMAAEKTNSSKRKHM
ncbi:caleosin-related, EF-hand domain pair [Artemisia annua]|uniref:Caleosin-related, EF-hand domain pair n=1 Tax=Artemisia annua TaxID=35608 RepID=A0A2U1PST4_ARTAN|nr:caleosin-related, EF-hand domain pair [Artemisia annua]